LKNPNFVVNPTRLSVKNLPLSVDDAQLRKLFADAAVAYAAQHPKEPATGRVTLAKIVRDKQRVDAEGVSKSSGFGFVEFSSHEVALAALRQLNNNALAFTATKRPIVTFAVDDQRKLLIRQRKIDAQKQWRDENAKEKQGDDESAKPNKKRKAEQSEAESDAKKPRTPEPADAKSAKAAKRKEIKQRKKELKRQLNAPAAAATATVATPVTVTEKPSAKPAASQSVKRKSVEPAAQAEAPAAEPKAAKKSKNTPDVKVSASKTEQKFDSLVESYKSQFFGSQAAKQATKRWFDQ
jgi:nucleolar protein 4